MHQKGYGTSSNQVDVKPATASLLHANWFGQPWTLTHGSP